jgi:fibronectin type 3 domain-containing protein
VNFDQFTARWTGQIQTSAVGSYTFRTTTDDGVRLWINDQLVIDRWIDQAATDWDGSINLPANTRVNVRMDYYEQGGGAFARLGWRQPGETAFSTVPTSALFSGVAVPLNSTYRYVRYLSPAGGWGNVAEIEFYSSAVVRAPDAPTGLGAVAALNGITLNWTDNSSNETTFNIERRLGTAGAWSEIATVGAGVTTYRDTAVVPGTVYNYRVRAVNNTGPSSYSNIASATAAVDPSTLVPAAPTALTATAPSSTSVSLGWTDNANNESQFIIERSVAGGPYTQVGAVGANVTTFGDPTVVASTSYAYRVYASNSNGPSGFTNVATVTTPGGTTGLPAAPSNLTFELLPGPEVRVIWQDNSNNETQFRIERRFAGWIWEPIGSVLNNRTSFTDSFPLADVVYEYRVLAANTTGVSAWADGLLVNTSSVPQPPAAPSGLVATPVSGTRVDLVWDDNSSNETQFKIERRILGGTFAQIATTAANVRTFADTTAAAGTAYEYRVRASTATLDSPYSAPASATTPGGTGGIPDAPSNLTHTLVGSTVRLNWRDNSTTEIGFRLQRRYAAWIWEDLTSVGPGIQTFDDTTAFGGVVYEYRVLALGSSGNSPFSPGVTVST